MGRMLRFLDALDHRYFLGAPPLREGETVTWSCPMGYFRRGLTRGGVLYATDHRVMFVPNLVERRLGVKRWESPRDEVEHIGRVSERNLLARGLGQAFVIRTKSGNDAQFAVYNADSVVQGLQAALSGSPPSDPT